MSVAVPLDERKLTEDARLRAVEQLGLLGTAPEERFDRVTRMAQQLFGVRAAVISLITMDRQWLKSAQGTDATSTPRRDAFCHHTIRTPDTLVVRDATTDPRFAANPYVTGEPNVRFYAGHPIAAPGGHRVGTLCLFDDRPREFSERERAQLEHLAAWGRTSCRAPRSRTARPRSSAACSPTRAG